MMKQEDTKQRILDKALELFSARGYDSVSVGEIAEAVGIRAPSLYNHFPGKQAIFDAIVESTAAQYEADTGRLDIHVQSASRDIPVFAEITEDALYEKVRQIFAYSLHNEQISRFRRMMTIEQFRSPELAALYSGRYVDRVLAYHAGIFRALMASGEIAAEDPDTLAMLYVAPVLTHLRPPAGAGGRVPGKAAAACDALFPVGPWRKQPGDIRMESQTLRPRRRVWFSIGRAFDIPGAMCYNLVTSIY
jgi:AcrR family transcriptional regulator